MCGVGGGGAGWVVRGGGVGWGGWWRCGRGEAIAPLEFPKLANAQPSNFGPLPYFSKEVAIVAKIDTLWKSDQSIT